MSNHIRAEDLAGRYVEGPDGEWRFRDAASPEGAGAQPDSRCPRDKGVPTSAPSGEVALRRFCG
jgi:hypothetical protein